jgi:hypothetical protein
MTRIVTFLKTVTLCENFSHILTIILKREKLKCPLSRKLRKSDSASAFMSPRYFMIQLGSYRVSGNCTRLTLTQKSQLIPAN